MREKLKAPKSEGFAWMIQGVIAKLQGIKVMGRDLVTSDFVRTDPTREGIMRLVGAARHFSDNHGIRASKVFDPETKEIHTIIWPASGWFHRDFEDAVVSIYGKRVILEHAEFEYDDRHHRRFSKEELDRIVEWMKASIPEESQVQLTPPEQDS